MASTIVTRSPDGTADYRAKMRNSNFVRSIPIGTNWTSIRVGMRYCFYSEGTLGPYTLIGFPRVIVGMNSGKAKPVWNSPDHFAGLVSSSGNWTWTAASAGNYAYFTTQMQPGVRIGNSFTLSSGTFGTSALPTDPTQPNRRVMFVDITKGTPNWTFYGFYGRVGQHSSAIDVTLLQFQQVMANVQSTPSLSDHTYNGPVTMAVDEATNGYLDTPCWAWGQIEPWLEICDVGVSLID